MVSDRNEDEDKCEVQVSILMMLVFQDGSHFEYWGAWHPEVGFLLVLNFISTINLDS